MKLLILAGKVCQAFVEASNIESRNIQKVKNDLSRDVVTALDMSLHKLTTEFVAEHLPDYTLLSEESDNVVWQTGRLREGNWLVVDPLDGSSNHALGLPHFGYMAAQVCNGLIEAALVVLPEHDLYLLFDGHQLLTSRPISVTNELRGAVYYAYPPAQSLTARKARIELMDLIDTETSGFYRCGSACVGLYQLLCGQHQAFFGHGVRPWDVLAYLPILSGMGLHIQYGFEGESMHLLASRRIDLVEAAARIITQQGLLLHHYLTGDVLMLDLA